MKQFIRYLSLIACVVVVGVWGWSYWFETYIGYEYSGDWWINTSYGRIVLAYSESRSLGGLSFTNRYHNFDIAFKYRSGLVLPGRGQKWPTTWILIPFWLLFTPLLLLTLKLWYHPLKSCWRGTNRQGFAVEMKESKAENVGCDLSHRD